MTHSLLSAADLWWRWMTAMSVQVAILGALIAILDRLLSRRTWPQLQAAFWWLVILKLLLPPTLTSPFSLARLGGAVVVQSGLPVESEPVSTLAVTALALWLAVAAWLTGLAVWRHRRLCQQWLAGPSQAPPIWLAESAQRLAARLELARIPQIQIRAGAQGAAVLGFFRPVVLLPAELLDTASTAQIQHVLLHELAHLKRRDPLASFVGLCVQICYWFHPVVWLARRRLTALREIGCDMTVANIVGSAVTEYRHTLLRHARPLLERPDPGWLGFLPRRSQLLERLDWLERFSPDRPWLRRGATAVLGGVILVSGVPLARPVVQQTVKIAHEEQPMPEAIASPLAGLKGSLQIHYAVLGMLAEEERRGASSPVPEGE